MTSVDARKSILNLKNKKVGGYANSNLSLNKSMNSSTYMSNEPVITENKVFKTYEHDIVRDPHEEIQMDDHIRDLFKLYDKDGDGTITRDELILFLNSIQRPFKEEDLNELLKNLDRDKDGKITCDELIFYLKTKTYYVPQSEAEEILDCFRVFDSNNDLTITKKELETIFAKFEVKGITKEDLDYFFEVVDKNGDNFISYAEFLDFWKMK